MADRLVLPNNLHPVAPCDAPEKQLDQIQLLTKIVHQVATHVETLSIAIAPTKPTTAANPTAEFDRTVSGRHGHDAQPVDSNDNPLEYIDPREWTDYASRTFAECLPPTGIATPCLWNPRHDEAHKHFTETA
jgi:hypothetical protein